MLNNKNKFKKLFLLNTLILLVVLLFSGCLAKEIKQVKSNLQTVVEEKKDIVKKNSPLGQYSIYKKNNNIYIVDNKKKIEDKIILPTINVDEKWEYLIGLNLMTETNSWSTSKNKIILEAVYDDKAYQSSGGFIWDTTPKTVAYDIENKKLDYFYLRHNDPTANNFNDEIFITGIIDQILWLNNDNALTILRNGSVGYPVLAYFDLQKKPYFLIEAPFSISKLKLINCDESNGDFLTKDDDWVYLHIVGNEFCKDKKEFVYKFKINTNNEKIFESDLEEIYL